jgi:hypothetical protein
VATNDGSNSDFEATAAAAMERAVEALRQIVAQLATKHKDVGSVPVHEIRDIFKQMIGGSRDFFNQAVYQAVSRGFFRAIEQHGPLHLNTPKEASEGAVPGAGKTRIYRLEPLQQAVDEATKALAALPDNVFELLKGLTKALTTIDDATGKSDAGDLAAMAGVHSVAGPKVEPPTAAPAGGSPAADAVQLLRVSEFVEAIETVEANFASLVESADKVITALDVLAGQLTNASTQVSTAAPNPGLIRSPNNLADIADELGSSIYNAGRAAYGFTTTIEKADRSVVGFTTHLEKSVMTLVGAFNAATQIINASTQGVGFGVLTQTANDAAQALGFMEQAAWSTSTAFDNFALRLGKWMQALPQGGGGGGNNAPVGQLFARVLREQVDRIIAALSRPGAAQRATGGGADNDLKKLMDRLTSAASFNVIGNKLREFTALASPGDVVMLNLALRDMQATIGQMLAPVVRVLTGLIREIADVFISFSPEVKRAVGAIAGGTIVLSAFTAVAAIARIAITALTHSLGLGLLGVVGVAIGAMAFLGVTLDKTGQTGKRLRDVFERFMGVVERVLVVFLRVIEFLVPTLDVAISALEVFVGWLDSIVDAVESLPDIFSGQTLEEAVAKKAKEVIQGDSRVKHGASIGAAVVPFSSGSSDEMYRKNAASSFQLGAVSPEAQRLDKILTFLQSALRSSGGAGERPKADDWQKMMLHAFQGAVR